MRKAVLRGADGYIRGGSTLPDEFDGEPLQEGWHEVPLETDLNAVILHHYDPATKTFGPRKPPPA